MKLKRKLKKKKRQLKEALSHINAYKAIVKELVMTLEAVKLSSSAQSKAVVFGENGIADKCQSEQTRAIVFMLRKELGLDKLAARQESARESNTTDSTGSSAPVLPKAETEDVLPSEQLAREKTKAQLEAELIQQARENGLKFQAAYDAKQRETQSNPSAVTGGIYG